MHALRKTKGQGGGFMQEVPGRAETLYATSEGSKEVKIILDQDPEGGFFIGISAGHGFVEIPIRTKQQAFDMYVVAHRIYTLLGGGV